MSASNSFWKKHHASPTEVTRRIELYHRLAQEHGWSSVTIHTRNEMAQRQRYRRHQISDDDDGGVTTVLDCWPTTGVMGSYLTHPRQGKTQLFRKQCDDEMTLHIFHDPRAHTGKGYHQRSSSKSLVDHHHHHKRERDTTTSTTTAETNEEFRGSDEEEGTRKRRRAECVDRQACRNHQCTFIHLPQCRYGPKCWFQPRCWFDHTHGLCHNGIRCNKNDCLFSHRNPQFYH